MLRKLLSNNKGTSVVEFALLAPLFFALIFGVIDIGRAYWVLSSMEYAVEAAGRWVSINSTATSAQVKAKAQANLYGIDSSTVTFDTSTTSNNSITYMTITATSTFNFIPGRMIHTSINLSKQVQVPLY
jgi:Flp pilus assembly protein TadG